ncbi:mechanosensitive ion channel [Nakamurella flava]|uniref:Mechanosensitive ion channel n=1 Tax=Nakamurella flava TaxID=2576308 RepID=A0A4U6QK85_9ACTN|nr:mechanosensitive ion channel family protein [Nakamurella flava]TKV60731.1 mechanosensitive ion channel [Nakamurella flava]
MTGLTDQPWFWWTVGIVVGLPIALFVLSELLTALQRTGSPLAKPVALVRNWVVPAAALFLLLTRAADVSVEVTWVRIVATIFGFMLLLAILAALNVALFTNAGQGTWRDRMPSIFVDIVRLVLVITGLGLIFSYVWDADVAGLFTFLGVSSVVLGFALQGAVGSIISGLLLLFEQPFKLGDWLEAGGSRGRVVEVNWRAVHIDTGHGIEVTPNASLAGASFVNLSRPVGPPAALIETSFPIQDPPDQVVRLLNEVAGGVPTLHPEARPTSAHTASRTFQTRIPILSPADAGATEATFRRWLWYAARRAGLHLDGADDELGPPAVSAAMAQAARQFRLTSDDQEQLSGQARMERYGVGETVQAEGSVPDALRFIVGGSCQLWVRSAGGVIPIALLGSGEYLGQTALTREPVTAAATVTEELTVLRLPTAELGDYLEHHPALARELGEAIEIRRQRVRAALADAQKPSGPGAMDPGSSPRVGAPLAR